MALSTIGTDPDYASLLGGGNRDPRLLMAQKLMDVEKLPTNNSTQSSFWANLLNQGARGALGGYLYQGVQADREKEAKAQETAEKEFKERMLKGPPGGSSPKGGGDAAPAAPQPDGSSGRPAPGPRASLGAGALPPDQQQAIVTSATNGTMVPPPLLHALITQESGWKPNAQGKGSDFGLGQVTASTAANPGYGLPPLSDADRADPYKNAAWSARYLEARGKAAGLTRPEDWSDPAKIALALKAYNGGGDPNYVANVTRHMVGKQADASPPPGSNIDALMAGVNAPKPRGIQLAENLFPGTATDAPTPILPDMGDAQGTAAPRVPVASAALDAPGAAAPVMQPPDAAAVPGANLALSASPDAAALPLPSPAVVPPPAAAPSPPPDLMPGAGPAPAIVPAPDAASVPTPDLANAAPVPAIVPQPDAAAVPQPTPALVPDNPMSRADPASLAAFNGAPPAPTPAVVPPPDPAIVPPPAPAMVPRPAAATLPPVQGPPVPPELLARKLQQSAPAPDNATEALNTASLAAARRGESFVPGAPGAGPTGPQLAAPLMSWAGNLTAAGAPLLTPVGAAGGPTGPQLAAPLQPPGAPGAASQQGGPVPLVTPASGPGDATGATTDTSATGGQSKGAASSAPAPAASTADAQANADWYLKMAREAQASRYPGIRATAGMLEAQGQALQRSVERRDAASERAQTHQETLDLRRQQAADAEAGRRESAADRQERIRIENERLKLEQNKPTEAATAAQRTEDRELAVKGLRWKADSNRTQLEQIPSSAPPGGPYTGKGIQAEDSNHVLTLGPKIANNTASDLEHETYRLAYNRLRDGAVVDIEDPKDPSKTVKSRLPGQDMTGFTLPRGAGGAPSQPTDPNAPKVVPGTSKPVQTSEAERNAAGFAARMEASDKVLADVGDPSWADMLAGKAGMVGNYLTTPKGQQYQQAAQAWIRAKLRQESGAAIGKDEMEQEFQTYFPQPGDSPEKLRQKREFRERETAAMRTTAGRAYTAPAPVAAGTPLPADKSQLQPGTVYTLRDGRRGKWTGSAFEVQ